ncbi:MAG: pilus assembly protein TadG-related protein [Bacteriovoracaceae bacterium]|nr:pilus assembly protein TadG-related protein [Bacteriovoracaceae bacterium]
MKLDFKSHSNKSREKGQVSIFFSTTILVMITLIAFIINIGIFVKAKINLQNATDAAAYAGASVQARQLTNIAYMNWEMRNVFKEWMFKYYVLGGLNLPSITGSNLGSYMNFTMQSYARAQAVAEDKYNFPSVCIDFANTGGVGMCTRYLVPGLPRFESSNVLGMDETTNAFIDTIVSEKSKNCSQRSQINFFTANTWAYNVKTNDATLNNITDQAPEIAANFMGAFPKAFEIGLRIRSLEAQVNHPPQGSICRNPGNGVDCTVQASSLNSPSTERAQKAFMSGFRNIGANGEDRNFKNSFTLKEVSPRLSSKINVANSLSTLLIPPGQGRRKYYLDLKLMTLNYATFYTAFTSTQGGIKVNGSNTISAEGQCNATKVGLPVPGYPLGFVKNPDFLTYYAVEGKAKFIGLFNPFTSEVVLKAYAAAKPFGGRIGPMLFDLSDASKIRSRSKRKSSPFITALDTNSFRGTFGSLSPGQLYAPGMPVPINIDSGANKFWMTDENDYVGGWISGPQIFYGIPNMVYEYPSGALDSNQDYLADRNVQVIARSGSGTTPKAGLYNRDMFEKFKNKLLGIGGVVTSDAVDNAILMVRSPTVYEANNYLIPTPENLNLSLKTDSWGTITGNPTQSLVDNANNSYDIYQLDLYAPIYSPNDPHALFKSDSELHTVLDNYLQQQSPAIEKYKNSMNLVAADIYNNNRSGATGQNTGEAAAAALSDLTPTQYQAINNSPQAAADPAMLPSCKSIAGKFIHFYSGDASKVSLVDSNCVTPLKELLKARWADPTLIGEIYSIEYSLPTNMKEQLFTAYRPGPQHDADLNGTQVNVLSGSTNKKIRNFYSTKLIPLKSIAGSTPVTYGPGKMLIYSDGHPVTIDPEAKRQSFENKLDEQDLSIDLKRAEH